MPVALRALAIGLEIALMIVKFSALLIWSVLRPVVVGAAGQTVFVGAAIHGRQFCKISVRWRRGNGPFERRGPPWIFPRALAVAQAPKEINDEKYLEREHDEQRDGRRRAQMLQRGPGLFGKLRVAVDAALIAGDASHEQRNKNHVKGNNRSPEMNFPRGFIHHAAKHLWIPEVDARENGDDRDGHKRVVKMSDDEIGVVQINVRAGGAEKNSRHAANQEFSDKAQSPEHR